MEHRTLGRSGLGVSRLSLGAMGFGASQGFMNGVTSASTPDWGYPYSFVGAREPW
jgi:aryl-alcohol dehydrogenase-like predicted oxidoreductase